MPDSVEFSDNTHDLLPQLEVLQWSAHLFLIPFIMPAFAFYAIGAEDDSTSPTRWIGMLDVRI